jgi:hypothetical protein
MECFALSDLMIQFSNLCPETDYSDWSCGDVPLSVPENAEIAFVYIFSISLFSIIPSFDALENNHSNWNCRYDLKVCGDGTIVQRISPRFSAGSSNQPTHFGILSHLDPRNHSRNKETTTPSNVVWVENLFFLCWHHKEYCFSPMMISIEIYLWCKALYVWSFII